jgi:hypothetical protein
LCSFESLSFTFTFPSKSGGSTVPSFPIEMDRSWIRGRTWSLAEASVVVMKLWTYRAMAEAEAAVEVGRRRKCWRRRPTG